jgi:hypothetical protein
VDDRREGETRRVVRHRPVKTKMHAAVTAPDPTLLAMRSQAFIIMNSRVSEQHDALQATAC